MHVLHVITRIENSGPNKVLIALATAQQGAREQVTVASLQPARDDSAYLTLLREQGVEVVGIEGGTRAQVRALARLAKERDITHLHCLRSQLLAYLARIKPQLVTSHNIPDEDWPHTRGPVFGLFLGWLHYALHIRAGKVAAINERMRVRLEERGGNVASVYNPVIVSDTPNGPRETPPKRLLFVAQLTGRKNQVLLLEALSRMGPAAKDLHVDLLGDGDTRADLEARAAVLKKETGAQVHIAGFVADPEPYFRNADLYVSPALSEGQPVAVLEALGYGLPCLLSDIPGHALQDAPEGAVEMFDLNAQALADALTRITSMPPRATTEEIADWGRRSFSPQSIAARYLELYDEVIAQGAGHA